MEIGELVGFQTILQYGSLILIVTVGLLLLGMAYPQDMHDDDE